MILQVRIYIAPEQVPEFFAKFKPIYDIVLAEPECVFFVVGEDSQEPGCISWMEGWTKDQDWFMDVQFKKEYYKDYLAATELMFIKPRMCSSQHFSNFWYLRY